MILEDDFCDIIGKARYGLGLAAKAVAGAAAISSARLVLLEQGEAPQPAEVFALAQVLSLRSSQLAAIAEGHYSPPDVPHELRENLVTAVFVQEVSAYAYVLKTRTGGVLIDCGGQAEELTRVLGKMPDCVFLTHGHHDHTAGIAAFLHKVPVYAHPELAARMPGVAALPDGAEVQGLRVIHSPGHSQDALTICGPGFAFVGDTIFAGSLGRAASSTTYATLLQSAARILSLPNDTALFSGHGPATTVACERLNNAFPVS